MVRCLGGMMLLLAQVGCNSFRDCSTEDASAADSLPDWLSETALYADIAQDQVSERAISFEPQYPLWTDGLSKRRWLVLPDGTSVDTSDAEAWVFPVGTQLFKEFSLDGVALETRLNEKQPGGWASVTYVWDGNDARRQVDAVTDVGGTPHDVPSAQQCLACHGGRADFTLGFSATQLDLQTRQELHGAGVLSDAVVDEVTVSSVARTGLGVLHGNCSHCHNAERAQLTQATECFAPGDWEDTIDFTLPPDLATVDDAPAVQTALWQLTNDDSNGVVDRMARRDQREQNPSMPPLGTDVVDSQGVDAVRAFVETLSGR